MTTSANQTTITSSTCGYSNLPSLDSSDVWSVDVSLRSICAPCEVWNDGGSYFFKTRDGAVSGPYESELLACQCAAIHRNPSLAYPSKEKLSAQGWCDLLGIKRKGIFCVPADSETDNRNLLPLWARA